MKRKITNILGIIILVMTVFLPSWARSAFASSVAITSPINGAIVYGNVNIITNYSGGTWENIYVDGNYFASSPPTTFVWNTTALTGSHTIQAKLYTNSGLVAQTSIISVTVNNGSVTILSPTSGAVVSSTVSINTLFSGPGSPWENLYIDGNYLASSPPSNFSWNSLLVPNGTHTIAVRVYNSGGLLASTSADVSVSNLTPTPTATPTPTVTPSPTPSVTPTPSGNVNISSPIINAIVSGKISITSTFTASSSNWVNFHIDGNIIGSATTSPSTFLWDSTTVSNGSHILDAKLYGSNSTNPKFLISMVSVPITITNGTPTPTPTPTTTPIPSPTVTPTPNPSPTPAITGLTGDPAALAAITGADTNIAHYGNYPAQGDGMGLMGGPLLTDLQAASLVKTTVQSSVEKSTAICDPTVASCNASTIGTSNAYDNLYFINVAAPNAANYMNQLNTFRGAWASDGPGWVALINRIDGACQLGPNPTSAEILQWGANKWGFNPILLYAEGRQEGDWDNDSLGDWSVVNGVNIGTSSGIVQNADRNSPNHAFPGFVSSTNTLIPSSMLSRENTCFDVDMYCGMVYASYSGISGWSPAGNVDGAIQTWFEGTASLPYDYTSQVYGHINLQDWVNPYFNGVPPPY